MSRRPLQLRRWIRDGVAAGMMLVALAAAVLWIASRFQGVIVYRETLVDMGDGSVYSSNPQVFGSVRGRLYVAIQPRERWIDTSPADRLVKWTVEPLPRDYRSVVANAPMPLFRAGFDWRVAATRWYLSIPHWLPVMAAGSSAWLLRRRERIRRRRVRDGQCAACGYDIRVTPHRCPECGLAAATS